MLGDRWTIHIVRDLLTGTTRFNEFIRGNPGLPRALLTRRLQQLKRADVIEQDDDGSYRLTASGRDLEPVVFGLTYLGHVPLAEAHRAGRVELIGSGRAVRSFIDAFQASPVAEIVAAEG